MNRYIFKKTQRFTILTGIMIIVIVIYVCVSFASSILPDKDKNMVQIEVSELHAKIEQLLANGQFPGSLPESPFAYVVFDISGKNLGSTIKKFQEDIDVRLLSTINEHTAPLIVDETQVGTLVVDYQPGAQWAIAFSRSLPLFVSFALWFVLLAFHVRFIRYDIIRPINELHDVVERMVKGDLNVSVSYDYDGEMGEFCHDFEAMRDELRDAAERERMYKEKERLLFASLSHDLKTPLSSISGYAESIKYGVTKDKAEVDRYIDIILKKTNSLTSSIEDILTHVQTQMHEMTIKKEEIYAAPLFEKLLAEAAEDAAAKGLTLDIQGEIPNVLIAVDPMRIEQIIQNIISNSLKYTGQGGRITVSVEKKPNALQFTVEDTGCGIRPEDVPFVFEPFFRGEKSRDPNISGSGLGLSIAKYIVEQHGGQITCESVLGEGARIQFSIEF